MAYNSPAYETNDKVRIISEYYNTKSQNNRCSGTS